MTHKKYIAANIARLRLDRQLTQDSLARQAGLSRMALGKIERGVAIPQARTLAALGKVLNVPVRDLVTPARSLESVRFRVKARLHGREQILAEVANWLDAYVELEAELGESCPFRFAVDGNTCNPPVYARAAREAVGFGPEESVRDICGLLENNGVKLLTLNKKSDAFFGLSIGAGAGGPAVVVNTWDRISVERWIFTAAHELGHLLLHPTQYQRNATELPMRAEREADNFASHFLMPETAFAQAWHETRGHPLLVRVLKVKHLFRVSYKTVLYRLVESNRETPDIWGAFQRQHLDHFGKPLRKTEEPKAKNKSEFAWNWSRSGEPEGLSRHDFVEDRLSRLVRQALEQERISLGHAAEILRLPLKEMRKQAREWVG